MLNIESKSLEKKVLESVDFEIRDIIRDLNKIPVVKTLGSSSGFNNQKEQNVPYVDIHYNVKTKYDLEQAYDFHENLIKSVKGIDFKIYPMELEELGCGMVLLNENHYFHYYDASYKESSSSIKIDTFWNSWRKFLSQYLNR